MSNITNAVRNYLQREVVLKPDLHIKDDEDLLMSGILDSISVMKLVAYLENEYDFSVPAEDVILENFGSISVINDYVASRVKG